MDNKEKLAEAFYYKAYSLGKKNMIAEAISYYKHAEQLAASTSNLWLQYKISVNLNYVNYLTGNYSLQLKYAKHCISIANKANNKEWLAKAYHNTARAFSYIGLRDSVIYYMREVICLISYISEKDRPLLLANIAYTYKHSEPDSAKTLFQQALTRQESSIVLSHLADIYFNEGNHEEAYKLWKRALTVNDRNPKDNIIHNLLEYDVLHGKTDQVCERVNEIIAIKDSIISSQLNDSIKELQFKLDQEAALHESDIITSNWQKGLLVSGLLITLLVAYIMISRYREKNKMQVIQLEINNLIAQREMLRNQGENALYKIDELNKEIKKFTDDASPKLKQGRMLYDQIADGKTIINWTSKEKKLFNYYYEAINHQTVNRIKKTKRRTALTTHQLLYLLLLDMLKDEKEVQRIMSLSDEGMRTLKSRTKPIETTEDNLGY